MPCVFPVLAVKAVGLAGFPGPRSGTRWRTRCPTPPAWWLLPAGRGGAVGPARGGRRGGLGVSVPVAGIRCRHGLGAVRRRAEPVRRFRAAAGAAPARDSRWRGAAAMPAASSPACSPCWWPRPAPRRSWGWRSAPRSAAGSAGLTLAVFLAMGLGLAAPYLVLAAAARASPGCCPGRDGGWTWCARCWPFRCTAPAPGCSGWRARRPDRPGWLATAAGLVLVGFVAWAAGLGQRSLEDGGLGLRGRRILHAAALAAALAALAVLSGIAASPAITARLHRKRARRRREGTLLRRAAGGAPRRRGGRSSST